jgi:hypothetical protein
MCHRKILFVLLFSVLASQGCASTYKERITSDPSGADIYWGYSQSDFVDTDYVTPFERSLYWKAWEARCYRVEKKGYYDSEVVCRSSEAGNRLIHFDLTPKPQEEVKPAVAVETDENKTLAVKEKYNKTAQDIRILLTEAVKERIPAEQGAAVQYIEKYLEDNGYKCYVDIFHSRKHPGKFAIAINRYSSEVKFNKDKFTEIAIIAVAILAEKVSWNPSDLFFDYSAIFETNNKAVGWAIISVDDCLAARNLFMSANNMDKFTTFWKSKIQYISDTDPQPIL